MKTNYIFTKPNEIESRSMQIIEAELGVHNFSALELPIVKRVIHTSADFDYKRNLYFSDGAVKTALTCVRQGALFVTDTNMALSGINKAALKTLGCEAKCFMADPDIAQKAKEEGTTRAVASMTAAATIPGNKIFAIGNAPTALIRLCELIRSENLRPDLIIGVPVGFVNVVESKEELIETAKNFDIPVIAARGRKGGSNIAAAICNALLYTASNRTI